MSVELPPSSVCIIARSERQAMDWSLVLASQGIEAVIDPAATRSNWGLWVAPEEHASALAAIHQYRLENRRWAWRQQLVWPEVGFHFGVLFWCLILILFHWASEAWGFHLVNVGAMNGRVPATGEWWRVVTAISLHQDVGHVAANTASGFILLGLAMARFGPGVALLASLMAGVAGNLAGLGFHPPGYVGLGASGMVMGALGLLAVQSFVLLRQEARAWRVVVPAAFGGLFLFILLGTNPSSDVLAHAVGFVTGGVVGGALVFLPAAWVGNPRLDWVAAVVALALFGLAWGLALTH